VNYAGICICHDRHWGDGLLLSAGALLDNPGYEATLIAALRETIRSGDNVVIVGGGVGVTAVVAALRTTGIVHCFEGSKQQAQCVQKTAARNGVANVSVHHAIVASSIAVYEGEGGDIMPASDLPRCDVLELDCEGAEVEILRGMTIQPRVILVETHGLFGAPTELVASLLRKRGYAVLDRGVAEPRLREGCIKDDIRVLLGVRSRDWQES